MNAAERDALDRRRDPHLRELIDEVVKRKQTFTEAEQVYLTASADLHQAIRRAVDGGATKACMGRAMGVTRERVVAMIRKAEGNGAEP